MSNSDTIAGAPLVTVLTPVFNGGKYLAECIESVLAQTYRSFEFEIVDNCSTDETFAIATQYAKKDHRIRVVTSEQHVGVIENHNRAFGFLSPTSKYCKVVSADDWILRDCLQKMVNVMEEHPTIAIVGSYQLKGDEIQWRGLSPDRQEYSGREVCRKSLLEGVSIFGPPTSSLYRSDLVRAHKAFFSVLQPHADICAYYEHLEHHDFGFVHEALSMERIHHGRVSTTVSELYLDAVAEVEYVSRFGPVYLSKGEFDALLKQALATYYCRLGGAVLKMKGKRFWAAQISRMREIGFSISWSKVISAAIKELLEELRSPRVGYGKLKRVLKQKNV